ncbi:hypothetical protein PZA11_002513 [Diplocarpon coronariae]|uniref:Glucanase n=1 Tax=Diplocarpon coronariae TaxID=2795749 RepID=A0A218ZAG8_9HELO|nr:cellulase [Marssonina coronariae]
MAGPVFLLLLGVASAMTPGPTPEVHPKLQAYECSLYGGCVQKNLFVVLDQLTHPISQLAAPQYSCGAGTAINSTACPTKEACHQNCVIDGISNYEAHGVKTGGSSIELSQINSTGVVVSPRVYLMDETEQGYENLQLLGKELTFDVETSKMPCGMNGALYLSEMDFRGAQGELNPTGAAYGSGYCDAQCYSTPFINGVGNLEGKGSCCNEMDIWEANSRATTVVPHPCNITNLYECKGADCEFNGVCDKWGCGFNPYAQGDKSYYGSGISPETNRTFTVDTSRPFTVVTQFPALNGTLSEIRRMYIQDGRVIQNSVVKNPATNQTDLTGIDSVNDKLCGPPGVAERYMALGATAQMGSALQRGMVLIFSIWWDTTGFLTWLDSGKAGPCSATEGDPKNIVNVEPNPRVTWSNVKWGEIGSTYTKINTYRT